MHNIYQYLELNNNSLFIKSILSSLQKLDNNDYYIVGYNDHYDCSCIFESVSELSISGINYSKEEYQTLFHVVDNEVDIFIKTLKAILTHLLSMKGKIGRAHV